MMNPTGLYVSLCRQLLYLHGADEEKYEEVGRALQKLHQSLLCRACKKICQNPYGSKCCTHLICNKCRPCKSPSYAGCRWCRNVSDLTADNQGNIIAQCFGITCESITNLNGVVEKLQSSNRSKFNAWKCIADGLGYCMSYEQHGEDKTESQNTQNGAIPKRCNVEQQTEPSVAINGDGQKGCNGEQLTVAMINGEGQKGCDGERHSLANGKMQERHISEIGLGQSNGKIQEIGLEPMESRPTDDELSEVLTAVPIKVSEHFSLTTSMSLNIGDCSLQTDTCDGNNNANNGETTTSAALPLEPIAMAATTVTSHPIMKSLHINLTRIKSKPKRFRFKGTVYRPPKRKRSSPVKQSKDTLNHSSDTRNDDVIDEETNNPIHGSDRLNDQCDEDDGPQNTVSAEPSNLSFNSDSVLAPRKCYCGTSSKTKVLTNMCAQSRCPCFRFGHACIGCRCRFCSNPLKQTQPVLQVLSQATDSSDEEIEILM